ncbi:MAG: sugar phosphate isomerase/epimerase family protein [Armatimonadota bacterium]
MQVGVSSYSFSPLVRNGSLPFLDIPAKAKELGFDFIEFSVLAAPEGETALSFAPVLREACDAAGLRVINYTIGADFLNGSNGDWQAEAERLQDEVRVAQILGATGMRHDATRGFDNEHQGPRDFAAALSTLALGCRAVTEFAADHGIRTMVENHGFFCQDSERVERLVNAVNHPNFGLLVDMGNFLCADENPYEAVARVAPYAFHVHAKDFHVKPGTAPNPGDGWFLSRGGNYLRGAVIGHGEVPVTQCLRILKRAGYTGNVSIEFEGIEESLLGISYGLNNLRRYVSEA